MQYTESAKYGLASVQLGELIAVQKIHQLARPNTRSFFIWCMVSCEVLIQISSILFFYNLCALIAFTYMSCCLYPFFIIDRFVQESYLTCMICYGYWIMGRNS